MNRLVAFFLMVLLASGCKEKYIPSLNLSSASFLVVEGFINSGTGPTVITLTRTTKVVDTADRIYERNADVSVQAENGSSIKLSETVPGVYSNSQLTLNTTLKYRVYIKTQSGKEYASDFSTVRTTPDIDSVSWKRKDDGVQTYVNTHDALGKTKYYQWKYEETWEFHSKYLSVLKYVYDTRGRIIDVNYKDPVNPGPDTTIFKCWKSTNLTSVLIGSSEKLSQDLISEQPTAYIPAASQQLSVLYSINVKQYALSEPAYRFLQQLKRNTEQLGTIFDAQPSDNNGNIRCITNAQEPVIGFVEVSQEKTKRIFISNTQVPGWKYAQKCENEIQVLNLPDSLTRFGNGLMLTTIAEFGGSAPSGIKYVYFGEPVCTDCTRTGVNKKPSFWP